MKNIVLSLVLLCGFIPVFAQKTLPPSLKPHAVNFTHALVKSLNKAGFEMPTMANAPAKPLVQQRSNPLVLDSTLTFYGYDFPGLNDSIPWLRTIYSYPEPDMHVETNYEHDGIAWQIVNRSSTYFDNLHRIVSIFSEIYDPATESFIPDSGLDVFPHGNSDVLIDSFFAARWNTELEDWEPLLFNKNVFDDQDRLLESVSSFDYLGTPLLFKDVYTYDASGDNILIETFATSPGLEFNTGKEEIQYINHLPVESITYNVELTGEHTLQTRTTYMHTAFGNEAQVDTYDWDAEKEAWRPVQSVVNTYDNAQRVHTKTTTHYYQETPPEHQKVEFAYIQGNDLLSESFYYAVADEDYYLSDRKFYYYNGQSTAVSSPDKPALPLVLMPNPTTDVIRLQLELPAAVQIFNTQGQRLHASVLEPNQALNLGELPNGLYVVKAQTGAALHSGIIVKQ